ncbi:MAG: hypothetical protein JWM78_274 [Verrucomicrobiaceae bacterium]|nr:hypothetical protein [Verrucomicrobiaceae bacterium]
MPKAIRRHHRERLKNKRRFHWGRDLRAEQKALAQAIDTPAPCSCWICKNGRSGEGRTLQELKSDSNYWW